MAALLSKLMDKVRGYDEEYYEYDDDFDESEDFVDEIEEPATEKWSSRFRNQSKIVDFSKSKNSAHQVMIIQPGSIEAAQEVTNHLRTGKTVICNFEKIDTKIAQRVMDFITGATYAIDGSVHKISSMIFVAIPKNVYLNNGDAPVTSNYSDIRNAY